MGVAQDEVLNQNPEMRAKFERQAAAVRSRLARLQELQPLSSRAQAGARPPPCSACCMLCSPIGVRAVPSWWDACCMQLI